MGSIFSYDSKPMQILMYIGDLIIMNFIYLLCCIPVFTIGAAQAGMYSAAKVMLDKEDDSSLTAAYFKGFTNGFGTVTGAWGLMTLLLAFVAFTGYIAIQYGAPAWLIAIGIVVCALFQTLIPLFHSRFSCTVKQLIRNAWFLMFAHPIRSLGVFIVIWLPVIVCLISIYDFMSFTPIWGTLYFSTAMLFAFTFMKKPFKTLIEHFNETHNADGTEKTPEQIAEEAARKEAGITDDDEEDNDNRIFKDVPEEEEDD